MEEASPVVEKENLEIARNPDFYKKEAFAPPRKGEIDPIPREEHIWGMHGESFERIGFDSFDQALPKLIEVAESPQSLRTEDKNGNLVHIDPYEGIVTVTRDKPFNWSNPPFGSVKNEPPLPPCIVTAYVLANPMEARDKIKRIKRRAA